MVAKSRWIRSISRSAKSPECGSPQELESSSPFDASQVCLRCPHICCRHAKPPLTRRRQRLLEAYVAQQHLEIDDLFARTRYTYPRETRGGLCVFYDVETRRCRVHPVKPETCVAGPITFDMDVRSGTVEWYLKNDEVCPLAQRLRVDDAALDHHLQSAKRQLLTLIQTLDETELAAILSIEEEDTTKLSEDTFTLIRVGTRRYLW